MRGSSKAVTLHKCQRNSSPGVIRQKVGQLILIRQQCSRGRQPGLNLDSLSVEEDIEKEGLLKSKVYIFFSRKGFLLERILFLWIYVYSLTNYLIGKYFCCGSLWFISVTVFCQHLQFPFQTKPPNK